MSLLFDPVKLGSLTLRNRFVRSATWEGMADEQGACTPRLIELVKRLAEGDVGLIITSHSYVRRDGQAGTGQIGIYSDDHIP
ncbi:NADH:flavin oxidoreductase, partial [bacterium]|nr:NADH:flavin oxidoreductase [bacterium]